MINRQWTLFFIILLVLSFSAMPDRAIGKPGFLVLAPDRGFLGNEEVRDIFAEFRKDVPNAVLAFATREKTYENLRSALTGLSGERNFSTVVVLPLFMSEHHALYQKAREAVTSLKNPPLEFARPFGDSYLAEEILFDRVEALSSAPEHEKLILVASGANSKEMSSRLKEDLKPLLDRAVKKYKIAYGGEIVVIYDRSASEETYEASFDQTVTSIKEAAVRSERVLVVPFNLGKKYTTMMSEWNKLQKEIRHFKNTVFDGKGVLPHPNVNYWLRQASARYLPLKRDEIGVIFIAHGSNYNWNEEMRQGIVPLRDEYITEDAFSMVDPFVVERAVRRLEKRGVKGALIVRIFSLEASFKEKTEYILGLRREYEGFPKRICSGLVFYTVGGVEASPHFAKACIDRIYKISQKPEKETVILLAHGAADDGWNDHWMNNLRIMTEYIRKNVRAHFRDIKYYTWREDWPEKRERAIKVIRSMVEEASKDGGIALVVPARTTGRGMADKFLEGLNYRYSTGFAPHPEFTKWLIATIEEGIAHLTKQYDNSTS